jgi:hypothetical protein
LNDQSELIEATLTSRLESCREENSDYWSFRGNAFRQHAHGYFQYPAMMVPQMVGELLAAIAEGGRRESLHVYDPFVGSGTVLTEAMLQGMHFTGQDINPLAILLCQAKTIPFFDSALEEKVEAVLEISGEDESRAFEADFPNLHKWFTDRAAAGLSRLRRAIRSEPMLWARRFLWVALAETVRLTSNSRTSTFKLHIRPKKEIDSDRPSPIQVFREVAERNLEHLHTQKSILEERGYIERGRYRSSVDVRIADSSKAENKPTQRARFDVLVTSPSYGDNATTVPYGQHAYLPLQWIDLTDIEAKIDDGCLDTTHEIDHRSLGGSRKGLKHVKEALRAASSALRKTLDSLKDQPPDRQDRVLAFCRDLDHSVDPAMEVLRPGAVMIWVIGNRRVGGRLVPLDRILADLLVSRGAKPLLSISRTIPSKRMAIRNSIAETMRAETIVVLRKGT